jgi:glycosyltransferase involved in cell wall biosynthesis
MPSAAPRVVLSVQNLSVPKDPRVWREARTLATAGFDVTVVSPRDRGQAKTEILEGVRIVRFWPGVSGSGPIGLFVETAVGALSVAWHLARLRLRGRIDVLHVANPPDTYFVHGWLVRRAGGRFIFDLHDPSTEVMRAKFGNKRGLTGLIAWMERKSLRTADVVLTTNGSFRQLAIERGARGPEGVVVVRTGPDEVTAPLPRAAADEAPRVVFAGVMGEQDGVEFLVRAVALLRARGRDLALELIGDGPDVARLHALVAELGLTETVTWSGWLSRDEMRARLAHGAVAVSPDDDSELNRKASMLKIADYLALGLPTVASDLPETRVTCGDAVLYVPPGDVDALADAIARVLDDADLRSRLSQAALERAPRLVWQPAGERLVATYRWLLGDGPAVDPEQLP